MRYSSFERYDIESAKMNPGNQLSCNGCRNKINIAQGYYRCKYRGCDYDVCQRCGIVAGLDFDSEEEDPVDDTHEIIKETVA